MGKVLKYIGWSFLGIIILVMGTIGVLFVSGAFKDDAIYLDTITFDSQTLFDNLDEDDTTLSKINDVLVANDNFTINTTFTPSNANAKTLNLKVIKGSNVVKVPKTIVAGEAFNVEIQKVKVVNVGSKVYYIVDNTLLNEDYSTVDDTTYEIYPEIRVIKIGEKLYKYLEYNVGGEVRIQATDSEGGTTWTQFEFFVDSGINGLSYDFSAVPGELENNTIVFNENDMTFTLNTTPVESINPSTGEVFNSSLFNFKSVVTTSSDTSVLNIKKVENLEKHGSDGDVYRYIRYTFNSLKSGTSTITSKTLPTYQMYLDYLEADNLFNTEISSGQGYIAVTNFAKKYVDYIIVAGDIVELPDGTVSTEGNEWYKGILEKNKGNFIINTPLDYNNLLNYLFVTTSQEIVIENVELKAFKVSTDALNLDLFETLKYNNQPLTRENLIKLFGIKLESTSSNVSESALSVRIDELKMYSVKNYQIFDSVDAIEGDELFTITKKVGNTYQEVPYYTPIVSEGTTKYLTYTRNDSVLGVSNPSSENGNVWTIRANKEQERDDDGTAIVMVLYDEVSGLYFDHVTKVSIKINQINVFSLNSGLIRDMSLSTANNHGKPNLIYVDLRYENIGTANSLIKDFTEGASYTNIKLFVTTASAKDNGVLRIRVKTKDGTENGEPMVYTMPVGASTVEVYEIDYKKDSSGLICIEALNTTIKYKNDGENPTSSLDDSRQIQMYVGVVRTNVDGEPVDADGNLVDEKFFTKEDDESVWEYQNQYDFIEVASESLQFDIYSYLQSVNFYTANAEATGDFVNRTTVDGEITEPVKMIVGQRFEMYVTNLTLDSSGNYTGSSSEKTNLDTAFADFYYNNLIGQNKTARFETNNQAAEVQSSISLVKGMIKIVIECKESTSSADVYIALDEAGNNFLETCTVNLQLSYATIAKETDTNNNDVSAFYSAGASTNQIIKNNDTLTIKGVLDNSNLTWQLYDSNTQENAGVFKFGGTDQNSLDYNINLSVDNAYEAKKASIISDIKEGATYVWTSSNTDYVTITEKADAQGYDPLINIVKGTPTGVNVAISCTVYMYPEAIGSSETKYNGTYFSFRFVLNIIQSDIDVKGYSIYDQDGTDLWQVNSGTTTSQKITGGENFDILKLNTARDDLGSVEVSRNPITATIDGLDIRNSLTFTIETYSSGDNPNQHNAVYFLVDGKITYTVTGLQMINDDYSLVVYAKDTYRAINCGIKISTYYTGYADYVYYITVLPNLTANKNLPNGKTVLEATRGVGDVVYMFNETGKTLDDYYSIVKNVSGHSVSIPLTYTITSNSAYGKIENRNKFIPSKVAPLSDDYYQEVQVLIQYTIDLPGTASGETYIYDTVSVYVKPYYNTILPSTYEFSIKSGVTVDLFTEKEYSTGSDKYLFNLSTSYTSGENSIDDYKDVLKIQIDDSEEKLKTILGTTAYENLKNNGFYLTDGKITTSASLTSDERIRIRVYFIEYDDKYVEITGDSDTSLYLYVKNTIQYDTDYIESNPLSINKIYDINYQSNSFVINYQETVVVVYNADDLTNNKLTLVGGESSDIFNKIITSATLKKLSNYNYYTYYGDSVSLSITYAGDYINYVAINYNDSVNEIEHYEILFTAMDGKTYQFHFELLPNITISKFYPINTSYEIVENNTEINLETNYIKQNNRVELAYNDVILNARLDSATNNSIVIVAPKDKLIASGLLDNIDSAILSVLPNNVSVTINGVDSIFDYQILSGSEYVNSGIMSGSNIAFTIAEGNSGGNVIVQVKAFNGATTEYNFTVRNNPSRYNVGVSSNAQVYANNEFNLNTFIDSCRLSNSAPDFTALRIIIVDFDGTIMNVKNEDDSFSVVNVYDLINYNATLKFKDVATTKQITFYMYTTTSIDGDNIVELHLTVKPNVIITDNQTSIPAGVSIKLANNELSPLKITKGDQDLTEINSGIIYKLVDENNNVMVYDHVSISSGNIQHDNINITTVVYVRVEVTLDGCIYEEVRRISFVPNISIVFDYERLATPMNYKNMTAASIVVSGDTLSNTASVNLWDIANNNTDYPITISDYYGNSLAQNSTNASKPNISFNIEESGNIIADINKSTGKIMYLPSNKANVQAKVKVIIAWGDVEYTKTYNIHFQPNIASSNGIVVEYSNKNGSSVDTSKKYLNIYGGSEVEVLTLNTNNTTAISSDVSANTLFMQKYTKEVNVVVNSLAINVYDATNQSVISFVRFNSEKTDLYEIVNDGGNIKIKFKAVKEETEVKIPYYLDLINVNGGGIFTNSENLEYAYVPAVNGELVIRLQPVITSVTSDYNIDNPYSLIIRNSDENNVANIYTLLNVLVNEDTTLDSSLTDKVLINKDYLAELFTISVTNSYAYKVGQDIVFNIDKNTVSKFALEFTIEGLSEKVTLYISYGSKATLKTIDPVKTFNYNGSIYYIIETSVYNYKLELKGSYDGNELVLEGSTLDSIIPTTFTLEDGTPVLGIYSSNNGTIDLSSMVEYVVQNRKIIIDGTVYYVEGDGDDFKLLQENGLEYTGEFELTPLADYVNITEQQAIVSAEGQNTVTFNGQTYYIKEVEGTNALFDSVDSEDKYETIETSEYVAIPVIDINNQIVYFTKQYAIVDEYVQLNQSGLTYMLGSVGDNDKFTLKDDILTLIPFYSTDLSADKKAFTFDVNSNNNLTTNITFYILPVETSWSITYNSENDFNVTAPDTGTIGTTVLNARYAVVGGTGTEGNSYKYVINGASNVVSIENDSNILKVDYQKFSKAFDIIINVQAYFDGELVTNSWTVTLNPLITFDTMTYNYLSDPRETGEQSVNRSDLITYGAYAGNEEELTFNLANSEDSKYVTIDGNKIIIKENLYLLEQKEIVFNVDYKTYINDITCSFNSNSVLKLEQNTKIVGMMSRFNVTISDSNTEIAGDIKTTSMNDNSSKIKVYSNDELTEYDNLTISISNFNMVVSGSTHENGSIEAKIEDGIIKIIYGKDSEGNYPSIIHASMVIKVKNGSDVIYTSDEINCTITV